MLAARQHGFGLDAKKLVQLRDLGVPASTIDVMVALSYPAKFAVAPRQYDTERGAGDLDREYAAARADDCYGSYSRVRMYDCYDDRFGNRYGYDYGYGYRNRYGYGYDPYRWNSGSTPIVVIVRPDDGDAPRTGGAVVKGRGYTRTGESRGTATPRRAVPTGSGATTTRATGSTTSTTRSSPPSTSGGSTTPRRTAKPRGGGN
jgi:hypothetical protein